MDTGDTYSPGYTGDQSDAALDAMLAAAEDRLLATVCASLDLEAGLTRIIGEPPRPGTTARDGSPASVGPGERPIRIDGSKETRLRIRIEADASNGALHHTRRPRQMRWIPKLLAGLNFCLLLYFFAEITGIHWTDPQLARLAFAVVLAGMVTALSFRCSSFARRRMHAYEDHDGAASHREIGAFTGAVAVIAVAIVAISALVFIATRHQSGLSAEARITANTATSLGSPAPSSSRPSSTSPRITGVITYQQGTEVYFDIRYEDPGNDAAGFGFVGVNGSDWPEQDYSFSSPSSGIVAAGSVAYPLNQGCGTGQEFTSSIEVWIYDTAGARSQPVIIHLACTT